MRKCLESRDYLMKCFGFVLLIGFISLGAIGGCGNNDGEQDSTQALTENDFVEDPSLFANPEDGVVVSFLESADAPEADNLTGEPGFDVIPLRYTRTLNHTFCFEDDNDDSIHFMILRDSNGEEVLSAQANEGCVTEVIEAGDYEMVLTHGEHVDKIETIFLIPTVEEEQVTKRDEFGQKEIKTTNGFSSKMHRHLPGGLLKYFESISNVFTHPARAQDPVTELQNATTLINTNKCEDCDLMGLGFSGKDLTGAFLKGANLSLTDLSNTNLFQANLVDANLTSANLAGANLNGAGLGGAILTDTVLSFATWVTGFPCDIYSIGMCNTFNPNPSPCDSLTQSDGIIKCLLSSTDNSIDLVDVAQQVSSLFFLSVDTPIAITAWGGKGGKGDCDSCIFGTSGGRGGPSGFASTVTSVSDFDDNFGQTSLFYYLGETGDVDGFCGGGGASTLVMLVENSPSILDVVLIAGGGGGATNGSITSSGDNGAIGGHAIGTTSDSSVGPGGSVSGVQGGSVAGDGLGGNGGSSDANGNDGIGGRGGENREGKIAVWSNGDPGVGSNGRGGNSRAPLGVAGCAGGGGGGYGGGGGASVRVFSSDTPRCWRG